MIASWPCSFMQRKLSVTSSIKQKAALVARASEKKKYKLDYERVEKIKTLVPNARLCSPKCFM